jgi:hypothetical protein
MQSLSDSGRLVQTTSLRGPKGPRRGPLGFELGSVISAGYNGRRRRWDLTLNHGGQRCYLSLSTDEVVRLLRGLDIAEADIRRAIVIHPRRHSRKDG